MSIITIKMKSGQTRVFRGQGRTGGSYANTVKFEGAFAVVIDEYCKRTAIPAADIEEITDDPGRY